MAQETNFPNGITDGSVKEVRGRQSVTGTATIATGLAAVGGVTGSLETIGVAAGDPFVLQIKPHATPGSLDVVVKQDDGTNAANPTQVDWHAWGTP
jgi:hypothetical protein